MQPHLISSGVGYACFWTGGSHFLLFVQHFLFHMQIVVKLQTILWVARPFNLDIS